MQAHFYLLHPKFAGGPSLATVSRLEGGGLLPLTAAAATCVCRSHGWQQPLVAPKRHNTITRCGLGVVGRNFSERNTLSDGVRSAVARPTLSENVRSVVCHDALSKGARA